MRESDEECYEPLGGLPEQQSTLAFRPARLNDGSKQDYPSIKAL